MAWRDILKFENNLGRLIQLLKEHHKTTLQRKYVPVEETRDFIKLYGKFMRQLQNPDINLGDFNSIATPMEQYYSKLVGAPEFHHREFGNIYTKVFEELEKMRNLGRAGDGI